MKKKDLIVVGIVAFFAAIFSLILSGAIFNSPKKNPVKVPVVYKISSNFPSVQNDSAYKAFFNDKALDPTQLITIGGSTNPQPFQGGQGR